MESIAQIKGQFEAVGLFDMGVHAQHREACAQALSELSESCAGDGRAGVRALFEKAEKTKEKADKELARLDAMREFECMYDKLSFICGIDEAGRGPLAGPVVAGAVILPKDTIILYLNDSKKLSAPRREALYDEIMEKAVSAAVGIADCARIDEINILQATYEAMRRAVSELSCVPDILLNDAVTIPGINISQHPIIKGDAKSVSIAAASILAKVTRDRMMLAYDELFPEYGFAANKGYGTKEHIEAIRKYGPSPIHRRSFITNFI